MDGDSAGGNLQSLQSLGIAAIGRGRHLKAVKLLRKALALDPGDARCHANLSVALDRLGAGGKRPELREEAIAECLEAIRLQPDFVDAICNLGSMLVSRGRLEEALLHFQRAVTLAPEAVNAIRGCAEVLAELKRWEEAEGHFRHWTELEPLDSTAWVGRGECYTHRDMQAEAAEHYERAYLLSQTPEVVSNLVSALADLGRNSDALYILYETLRANPNHPSIALVWANLGCVWRRLGRQEASLLCYDHAVRLAPDLVPAAWGRSLSLLSMGRMGEGWKAYEWGLKSGDRQPLRKFDFPRWDGTNPAGKTILLWMEQGLGDHLAFAGMIPDLLRMGAHWIVECEYRLVTLFQRSFPGVEVVPQTDPPHPRTQGRDIDFEVPSGSLMQWLRPTVRSFPWHTGYLVPDPQRAAEWKARIRQLGTGPKIGVAWRSLKPTARFMDSTKLSQWGPILSIPGIHWVNLQCGWREDELQEIGDRFDARLHVWSGLDLKDNQEELAALIPSLDIVITAFTATAQLAGALGTPAWVLSHLSNQSWWSLGTKHCPWHPSIRFFLCGPLEPWEKVIGTLAAKLRKSYQTTSTK